MTVKLIQCLDCPERFMSTDSADVRCSKCQSKRNVEEIRGDVAFPAPAEPEAFDRPVGGCVSHFSPSICEEGAGEGMEPTDRYGPDVNTRTGMIAECERHCHESVALMWQRNQEYAKSTDPYQNFRRLGLLSLVQEMDNVICRMFNYADAMYRGADKPLTKAQIEDCELDMHNFAELFHCFRISLEGDGK